MRQQEGWACATLPGPPPPSLRPQGSLGTLSVLQGCDFGPAAGPKPSSQSQFWNLKNVLWSGLSSVSDSAERPGPPPRAGQASPAQGCSLGLFGTQSQGLWECGPSGQAATAQPRVPARR